MFFLAIATSFPEIVTAITATHYLGRIGLGYGDIVGSVIVNLMILAVLDLYYGRGRILAKVSDLTRMTGLYAAISGAVLLTAVLFRSTLPLKASLGNIGIESIAIFGMYFLFAGILHRQSKEEHGEVYKTNEPIWKIWFKFAMFLAIVMFLAMWMAKVGEKIIVETDLSQTFTGTLFLGFATSLPEIIVSFAALRAGSIDMAVGNILGSNLFDVSVVPILDALTQSPILGLLTHGQLLATAIAAALLAITAAAMYKKRETDKKINLDTALIFTVGFAGFVLLYFIR